MTAGRVGCAGCEPLIEREAAHRRWQYMQARYATWRNALWGWFLTPFGFISLWLAFTRDDVTLDAFGAFLLCWGGIVLISGGGKRSELSPPKRCWNCGYDMHGNTTGRCPECGSRM